MDCCSSICSCSYLSYEADLSAFVDRELKAIEKQRKIREEGLRDRANQFRKLSVKISTRQTFTRSIGYKRNK